MKPRLTAIFGPLCACVSALFFLLAALFFAIAIGSIFMSVVDHSPDNHWTCGVVIYGFQTFVTLLFGAALYLAAWRLLDKDFLHVKHFKADNDCE